jgi:hypothetical protein
MQIVVYGNRIFRVGDRRTEPPPSNDLEPKVPRVVRWDDDRSLAAEEARLHALNVANAAFYQRKLR